MARRRDARRLDPGADVHRECRAGCHPRGGAGGLHVAAPRIGAVGVLGLVVREAVGQAIVALVAVGVEGEAGHAVVVTAVVRRADRGGRRARRRDGPWRGAARDAGAVGRPDRELVAHLRRVRPGRHRARGAVGECAGRALLVWRVEVAQRTAALSHVGEPRRHARRA